DTPSPVLMLATGLPPPESGRPRRLPGKTEGDYTISMHTLRAGRARLGGKVMDRCLRVPVPLAAMTSALVVISLPATAQPPTEPERHEILQSVARVGGTVFASTQ